MNDFITYASDGQPSVEREHPSESDTSTDDQCHDCSAPAAITYDGVSVCLLCAGRRAADDRQDRDAEREEA